MNSKAASKWNPISTLLVLRHPAKQPPTCHLILYLLRLKVLTSHPCALHNMADGQLRTAPKAAAVDPVYAEKVLLRGHGVLIFHSQSCRRISTSDQVHFTYSADNRQQTTPPPSLLRKASTDRPYAEMVLMVSLSSTQEQWNNSI